MANWKNLRKNPPSENCNICLKIGDNFETFSFFRYNERCWSLRKYPRTFTADKVPEDAQYINLDDII